MNLLIDFVLVVGIVLSILPIVGILRLKERSRPQYLLLVFWALILNVILYFYASLHELSVLKHLTNYLQPGVRLLIPPLCYVYVKSIFLEDSYVLKKHIKHFAVFFIYLFDYLIPMAINPNTKYIETIHLYAYQWSMIQDIFGIFYFLMALRLLYKFRKLMKNHYSSIGEEGFLWVEKFLIGFLLVLLVDLILAGTQMAVAYPLEWSAYLTVFFLIGVMAYLGYDGLTRSTVFLPPFLIEDLQSKIKQSQVSSSYLKLSEQEDLNKRFKRCMRAEKMYLLKDLNSKSLAAAMGTSERKLSAFFKEVLDSNFYDAINAYRVEEAKHILKSEALKNHSITGIAHSCGFSSKSSFYRIFKKSTNLSPLAYVKMTTNESHRP